MIGVGCATNMRARAQSDASPGAARLVGQFPVIVQLMEKVDTIADTHAAVLVTGESGTGKELVARMLHERSARRERPLVVVNCAAVPPSLIEAELFGHERGAFTGAVKKRDGRFKAADGGTLFLDEIGETPLGPAGQAACACGEGSVVPVRLERRREGGRSRSTSRATNRDLKVALRP